MKEIYIYTVCLIIFSVFYQNYSNIETTNRINKYNYIKCLNEYNEIKINCSIINSYNYYPDLNTNLSVSQPITIIKLKNNTFTYIKIGHTIGFNDIEYNETICYWNNTFPSLDMDCIKHYSYIDYIVNVVFIIQLFIGILIGLTIFIY